MRVYKTAEIRNVAVVGHGASGKTSLVDALAFVAGTSKRHGSVKDGTALTDYTPDEIERKYSINLAVAVAEWMDTKLNLTGEVEVAGRVDEVELRVHPFGDGDGEVDGVLAFDFVGGVIGEGGAVFHGPVAFARAGHERKRVDQRGLAARAVAYDRHVADLRCLVHAHGRLPLLEGTSKI